jgi:GntR family transcriptional regulator
MEQQEEKNRIRHRDEAVELIECYLQRHDLAPHAKLPSEREMCEMWGLNRATLRAALRRLIELGRIYSLKGSGTYVAPPKLERNLQDAKSTTESVRGCRT